MGEASKKILEPAKEPQVTAGKTLILFTKTRYGSLKEACDLVAVKQVRVLEPKLYTEIIPIATQYKQVILVYEFNKQEQYKELAELAVALKEYISLGTIKLILISAFNSSEFKTFVKKIGCDEVLQPKQLNGKRLKFKFLRTFSVIENIQKVKVSGELPPTSKSGLEIVGSTTKSQKKMVIEVDPLTIADDCWIIRKSEARWINDCWVIPMLGPGKIMGNWIALYGESETPGESFWEWQPHSPETDEFVKSGKWIFCGKRPEFIDYIWTCVGKNPKFTYTSYADGTTYDRFACSADGSLSLARNSSGALEKIPLIRSSFEYEIHLSKSQGTEINFHDFCSDRKSGKLAYIDREPLAKIHKLFNSPFEERESLIIMPSIKKLPPEKQKQYSELIKKQFLRKTLKFQPAPVESKKSYLIETTQQAAKITIWSQYQKFIEHCRLVDYSATDDLATFVYPQGFSRKIMQDKFLSLAIEELYFNINLPRVAAFFVQKLSKIDFSDFVFKTEISEHFFEVQRRNSFRFSFEPGKFAKTEIDFAQAGSSFLRNCDVENISMGGLKVILPPELEGRGFKVGYVLPRIKFTIYDHSIECMGTVRWIHKNEMGLQFLNIDAADAESVNLFVLEESHHYFQQYLEDENK